MKELSRFKNKKTCNVCLLPIIYKVDAKWLESKTNGIKYPLNIHNGSCYIKVVLQGKSPWTVSKTNRNNINQPSLFS